MIQEYTRLNVADNTGAKEAMCIKVLGRGKKRHAQIGDIIVVSIKSATPRGTVKRKEIQRGVIVRQVKPWIREDGSTIRFDDNAIVIINTDLTPKGTRVFGPIARELREKGFMKIISMAGEVV